MAPGKRAGTGTGDRALPRPGSPGRRLRGGTLSENRLLINCTKLFHAMVERSTTVDDSSALYEGSLTNLLDEIGVGRQKYSYVVSKLVDMGCIEQLRRGNAQRPSQWLLYHEPDKEIFYAAPSSYGKSAAKSPTEQRIYDLTARLSDLEDKVEMLWSQSEPQGSPQ